MNVTEATEAWEDAKSARDLARESLSIQDSPLTWNDARTYAGRHAILRGAEAREQKEYNAIVEVRSAASIARQAWDEAEVRLDKAKVASALAQDAAEQARQDAQVSYLVWCELAGITQD